MLSGGTKVFVIRVEKKNLIKNTKNITDEINIQFNIIIFYNFKYLFFIIFLTILSYFMSVVIYVLHIE
jgi:hypothetical protein